MAWNPFATVSDYPTMLNRIAIFSFFSTIGLVALARTQLSCLEAYLAPLSFSIPIVSDLKLPLGTVLPAFLIAFLSRVLKFHDRLSDLLGIRQRFDVAAILLPLAAASGGVKDTNAVRKIRDQREHLMYATFYKYASSSPGKAVIETHYITMALDQWAWYWIILEAQAIWAALAVAFLIAGRSIAAGFILLGVVLGMWLLAAVRRQCEHYALQEVERILEDGERRNAIRRVFGAL